MSTVNILQISDLHRGRTNQVRNAALLDSILSDLSYFMRDATPIHIIAVCGDLVQGVQGNAIECTEQIASQYREAKEFLTELCTEIVGGRKDRIVVVPGNHDVSWPHSYCSMHPKAIDLSSNQRKQLLETLVRESTMPDSKTRWSWHDLCFMEIHDDSLYSTRMEEFCKFYNSFYEGLRNFSLLPEDQFSIYDYPDLGVAVLGLNSCDSLDHCNHVGRFNPDALGKALRELKRSNFSSRIKIAIWHHGLGGPPYQTDYLDSLSAQNLIVNRFALGLHGHQHIPDFLAELGRFGHESRMLVVGTGTLCGAPEALPPGQMRGYNIISLDTSNGEIRLFPREMKQSNFETPVWGKKTLPYNDKYPIVTNLGAETMLVSTNRTRVEYFQEVAQAECLIGNRQYENAVRILKTLNGADPVVKRLLVECYFQMRQSNRIIELCREPTSIIEAIYVLSAAEDVDDRQLIKELLNNRLISTSNDPSLCELRRRLQGRIRND